MTLGSKDSSTMLFYNPIVFNFGISIIATFPQLVLTTILITSNFGAGIHPVTRLFFRVKTATSFSTFTPTMNNSSWYMFNSHLYHLLQLFYLFFRDYLFLE